MKRLTKISLAAMLCAVPLAAQAQDQNETSTDADSDSRPMGEEARIPFVDMGAIYNFKADGRDGIWIQDRSRDWYYGTISGPCTGLPFANAIGVETRGLNALDKFGVIVVEGQRCYLNSFVHSPPPPSGKDKDDEEGRDADSDDKPEHTQKSLE